jgi:hypothetical protein
MERRMDQAGESGSTAHELDSTQGEKRRQKLQVVIQRNEVPNLSRNWQAREPDVVRRCKTHRADGQQITCSHPIGKRQSISWFYSWVRNRRVALNIN